MLSLWNRHGVKRECLKCWWGCRMRSWPHFCSGSFLWWIDHLPEWWILFRSKQYPETVPVMWTKRMRTGLLPPSVMQQFVSQKPPARNDYKSWIQNSSSLQSPSQWIEYTSSTRAAEVADPERSEQATWTTPGTAYVYRQQRVTAEKLWYLCRAEETELSLGCSSKRIPGETPGFGWGRRTNLKSTSGHPNAY